MKMKTFTLTMLMVLSMIYSSFTVKAQAFLPDSVYMIAHDDMPSHAYFGTILDFTITYADTIVTPLDTIITPDFHTNFESMCINVTKDTAYVSYNKYYAKYRIVGFMSGCGWDYVNHFDLRACNGAGHCSAVSSFVLNLSFADAQYTPYMKADAPTMPFYYEFNGSTLQSFRIPLNDYFANPLKREYADTLHLDSLIYGTQDVWQCDVVGWQDSLGSFVDTVSVAVAWNDSVVVGSDTMYHVPTTWMDSVYVASSDTVQVTIAWQDTVIIVVDDTVQVPTAWGDSTFYVPVDTMQVPTAWGDSTFYVPVDTMQVPTAWGDSTFYVPYDTSYIPIAWGDSITPGGDTLHDVPIEWIPLTNYIEDTVQVPVAWGDSIIYVQDTLQVSTAWGDSIVYVQDTVQVPTAWGDSVTYIPDTLHVPIAWQDSIRYVYDTVQVATAWMDSVFVTIDTLYIPIAWQDSLSVHDTTYVVPIYDCHYVTVPDSASVVDTIAIQHLYYPPKPLHYVLLMNQSSHPPHGSVFALQNDTLVGFLNEIYQTSSHSIYIPIYVGNDTCGIMPTAMFNYLQNQLAYLEGVDFTSTAHPGDFWSSQFTIGDTIQNWNDTLGLSNNFVVPDWVQIKDTSYIVPGPTKGVRGVNDIFWGDVYVKMVTLSGIVPPGKAISYDFDLSWCDWAGLCTQTAHYTLDVVTGNQIVSSVEDDLQLFPNPVEKGGTLTLSFAETLNNAIIKIYNIMGQEVYSQKITPDENITSLQIDSDFHTGIFIVDIEKNGVSKKMKLMVQ